jgi:hypothetical protein
MSEPSALGVALSALDRIGSLLLVLDREHTHEELYTNLRGVRHELATAQEALRRPMSPSGPPGSTSRPIVLEMPHWAACRAYGTQPDSLRHKVLAALGSTILGRTDWELAEAISRPVPTAQELRWELVKAGWVGPWVCPQGLTLPGGTAMSANGVWRRRSAPTARPRRVWAITPAGSKALGKLESGQEAFELEGLEVS